MKVVRFFSVMLIALSIAGCSTFNPDLKNRVTDKTFDPVSGVQTGETTQVFASNNAYRTNQNAQLRATIVAKTADIEIAKINALSVANARHAKEIAELKSCEPSKFKDLDSIAQAVGIATCNQARQAEALTKKPEPAQQNPIADFGIAMVEQDTLRFTKRYDAITQSVLGAFGFGKTAVIGYGIGTGLKHLAQRTSGNNLTITDSTINGGTGAPPSLNVDCTPGDGVDCSQLGGSTTTTTGDVNLLIGDQPVNAPNANTPSIQIVNDQGANNPTQGDSASAPVTQPTNTNNGDDPVLDLARESVQQESQPGETLKDTVIHWLK